MRRPGRLLATAALTLGLGVAVEAKAVEAVIEISFGDTYYRAGRITIGPEATRPGGGEEASIGACGGREGAGEPARGGEEAW